MYAIFDIALDCDFPLPELDEIETAGFVINVITAANGENIPKQVNWFHHWLDSDGDTSISCARHGEAHVLRFPNLADFLIFPAGNSIKCFPQSNLTAATIRHLLLDQVVPRVLGQQGRLVVHASAVSIDENTGIVFVGESGQGKSTIASSFHQHGAQLMTDDCLLLESENGKISGIPNYYGLRLFDDSTTAIFGKQAAYSPVAHYSEKIRLDLSRQTQQLQGQGTPITTLFLLDNPVSAGNVDVVVDSIQGADELISMIKQTFILDVGDKLVTKKQFKNMGKIISSDINIYRIQYPRKHELLPVVRNKILSVI